MPNFDIDQTIKTPEDFFIDNSTENRHHVTVESVPVSENLELSTKISSSDTPTGDDLEDLTQVESKIDNSQLSDLALAPEQINPMISLPPRTIDINSLRVAENYADDGAVEEIKTTIPYGKPKKQDFVRVHPGDDWQIMVAVIEDENTKELWVIPPSLIPGLEAEISCVNIRLAINPYGKIFLWPLKLSRDGRTNAWNQSALETANIALTSWVRMVSDQKKGHYLSQKAKGEIQEPQWPDMTFEEIFQLAFKDRVINDLNHPFLRQLRGEF